jgi:hypothetical protein
MVFVRLALCAAIWLGYGLGQTMAQPAPRQFYPLPGMTTDGPEYCGHLVGEFTREQQLRPPASAYARMLAADGREMCDRGHLKGGIERLRRALILLREGG